MPRRKEYSRFVVAADALGVTHLIFGTLAIILGEFTDFFKALNSDHGGVQFVLRYLDRPVYAFMSPFIPAGGTDARYTIMVGLVVVLMSSIVYGAIAYLVLKFAISLFRSPD